MYSDIMTDYLNEWLSTYDNNNNSSSMSNSRTSNTTQTQPLVDRLQHFLTADASLLSTRSNGNNNKNSSSTTVATIDVLERIQPKVINSVVSGMTAKIETVTSNTTTNTTTNTITNTNNANNANNATMIIPSMKSVVSNLSLAMEVDEIIHVTHAEVVTWRWDPHVQYVIRTRASKNSSILYVTRRRARFFNILNSQLKKMGYKDLPTLPGNKGTMKKKSKNSTKVENCSLILLVLYKRIVL